MATAPANTHPLPCPTQSHTETQTWNDVAIADVEGGLNLLEDSSITKFACPGETYLVNVIKGKKILKP